ncbi:MAG: PilZ domain-containing protein [Candidatus Eremiobacteraeota bacterium]|nr:PilZ domain-containing protein [Candidatus Eremiobacteraeota bacterium]MBV8204589.1 PilZ domain-containing protein [Candidatus Eremiobacteraeota bacterium]MBV8264336.1 PilZ domain-containing protein [Candidatus Eremiobacteraeota bacterium]MBV8340274.1 PilZ domain-containing protein [Candidatus Eremiobacteraeota bacterium]MBV8459715.1 PilZ domain-containing protein [Candidatus Eremiobacteraeota bacterium]
MSILDAFLKLFVRQPQIRMPRRWPRIVVTDATVLSLGNGPRQPIKLANLSAGGARIVSSFTLEPRERVTLTVPLGPGNRKELPAEVVYCTRDARGLHYTGGVRFSGAGSEGIADIVAFIEEERRRRSGPGEMWQG